MFRSPALVAGDWQIEVSWFGSVIKNSKTNYKATVTFDYFWSYFPKSTSKTLKQLKEKYSIEEINNLLEKMTY